MPKPDLNIHLSKIDELTAEIENIVPPSSYRAVQFRSDLAGLLVVAMAATYETCVKEIFCNYANQHHIAFGEFALRNYEKLNSRIQIRDLKKYCEIFDPSIQNRFKARLARKKSKILERSGKNIETSYEQILSWRHAFAHARIRTTTIEEATATHRVGKRVIYVLDDAFNRP